MLILAAVLAIFVYGVIAAMLGTILPGLAERFHLTPKQNGVIAFAQALGLMIASLGVGPLIDNEGKKIGLIIGLALIALALASLPKASGYGSIIALLFLLGLGGGVVVTGANALVSDVAEAHRGTALNLVNLFFGLGGMATPFIAANLLKRDTVKLCYAAGVFAVVALAVQWAAPIPGPTGVQSFVLADAGAVLGKPILLLCGLLLFLYVSCEVGIWNWLAQHLIAQGIPESRALNVLSLGFALGLLVGRVAVSPILITVPPATVTLVSAVAMAVTSYLLFSGRVPLMTRASGGYGGPALVGCLAGGAVGFLGGTSPTLSFLDVLTRGASMRGIDAVLRKPVAEIASNYMLAGALAGLVAGLGLASILSKLRHRGLHDKTKPSANLTPAWILVFITGVAMAPVFPTTLAIVGDAFPRMTGTAIGFAITCGWLGLAVSSRIIGAIAGGDPKRLKKALLVIPAFSVLMVAINLAILSALHK
ncbi:MAG: MFS transporter [Bryobacteraceae bacterium]|jgi:fucose permease